jgi:hypothetical protein
MMDRSRASSATRNARTSFGPPERAASSLDASRGGRRRFADGSAGNPLFEGGTFPVSRNGPRGADCQKWRSGGRLRRMPRREGGAFSLDT